MSKEIGLRIGYGRPFGRAVCEGVADALREFGAPPVRFVYGSDPTKEIRSGRYAGFVVCSADRKAMSALADADVPAAVLSSEPLPYASAVDADHRAIGRLAASHFLDKRASHFAYVGNGRSGYSELRWHGFRDELLAAGLADCTRLDVASDANLHGGDDDFTRGVWLATSKNSRRLCRWLDGLPKPVAVFCADDRCAWEVCACCRSRGLDVPKDVAVIGVDNDTLVCELSDPAISSVDPNARAIGFALAKALVGRMRSADKRSSAAVSLVQPAGVVQRTSSDFLSGGPAWLLDAMKYIRANVGRNLLPTDVCAHVARSYSTVESAFRHELQSTIQKEIAKARMETACRILKTTDAAIGVVAKRSGFSSAQYFCRCFSEAFGRSPTDYRNEAQ